MAVPGNTALYGEHTEQGGMAALPPLRQKLVALGKTTGRVPKGQIPARWLELTGNPETEP